MLFNSLEFFIFFPLATGLYFLFPHKRRWIMLLAASCVFYAFFSIKYLFLLVFLALISYFCAIFINKYESKKRIFFIACIFVNCAALFLFKYFNFFNENIGHIAKFIHWNYSYQALRIIFPIGMSFYVFQILGYVIDVYTGSQKAEKHLGIYFLFILFYPKLLAGPIEKSYNFIPQFYEKHVFDYQQAADGLKLMAWGLFQKIVIADRLSLFVTPVFSSPKSYPCISLAVATVFFAFQIYCDFAGYSDIARGSAQAMGFRLINNFNRPYFSKSIYEFWRRWHISLSTWLRDYIYMPLAVYKRDWGVAGIFCALMATFIICGLWHGASWTFVVWGFLNGVYIAFGILTKNIREKFNRFTGLNKLPFLHKIIQVCVTFLLVCIGWIFFKANSIGDAFYILRNLLPGIFAYYKEVVSVFMRGAGFNEVSAPLTLFRSPSDFLIAVVFVGMLVSVHLIQRKASVRCILYSKPLLMRWCVYYLFIMSIILFTTFGDQAPFVYFKF